MRESRFRGLGTYCTALVLFLIGAPRFELGTSCPPDKRANQAAPRPVGSHCSSVPRWRNGRRAEPDGLSGGIASDALAGCAKRVARTRLELLPEALVEAVDQIRHRLQLLRDHAQSELAEVLRLDAERLRELADDLVGRDRAIAVDEVVQIAGRELRLVGQRAVGDAGLPHQALDRVAERLVAELASPCH